MKNGVIAWKSEGLESLSLVEDQWEDKPASSGFYLVYNNGVRYVAEIAKTTGGLRIYLAAACQDEWDFPSPDFDRFYGEAKWLKIPEPKWPERSKPRGD